jgi:RHS repeat-associated protein
VTLEPEQVDSVITVSLQVNNSYGRSHTVYRTITIKRDHQSQYFVKDHLGSPRVVVDGKGAVLSFTDYYPFGMVMPGRAGNISLSNDRVKFTGYLLEEEGEQDTYHAEARGYDPVIGRFTSRDPITQVLNPKDLFQINGGKHLWYSTYSYAFNNPVNLYDPDGRSPKDPGRIKRASQAGLNAVINPSYTPGAGSTYCNVAVGAAVNNALNNDILADPDRTNPTGYPVAATMLNEIMLKQPDTYEPVDIANVQEMANNGDIVIGATSDHIVMAVPGSEASSGKWERGGVNNGKAPMVMDGRFKREQPASDSWGATAAKDIKWFRVRETKKSKIQDSNISAIED